jgi:uncharacterized SAM-binding protein YcdF (DUF218 family)
MLTWRQVIAQHLRAGEALCRQVQVIRIRRLGLLHALALLLACACTPLVAFHTSPFGLSHRH